MAFAKLQGRPLKKPAPRFAGAALAVWLATTSAIAADAFRWSVKELTLTAEAEFENPYTDVEVRATFVDPGRQAPPVTVRGFWDGGLTYRVRFTPPHAGTWKYTVSSLPRDAGLEASGQFEAGNPPRGSRGFVRRDTEYPTSFVFDDGTRYFMWGTTYYHLLLNARAGDRWQEAIAGAMRYGMNRARISLVPSEPSSKSGGFPASSPFLDDHATQLDLEHWRAADRALRYMNQRGFIADMILFWRKDERSVSREMREADQRYLRYALARYAAFPNVIWCMVNEWNYSSVPREYWNELGRLVRAEDPWSRNGRCLRALSIHQQTRPDWNFTDQEWPSHAILQLGVRNRGTSARIGDEWQNAGKSGARFRFGDEWGNHSIVRNWTGTYPVVNDEYGYIGEPRDDSEPKNTDGTLRKMTREKHRNAMWGIAVAGGYAAMGDKNDYGRDGSPYFSAIWQETAEYEDVKHLVEFFTKRGLEYWKMAPRNELVKSGRRVYVLAEPGSRYVVYAAAGGDFDVDLRDGAYQVTRYDPRTGETERLADAPGEAVRSFSMPDERDWVLDVQRLRN